MSGFREIQIPQVEAGGELIEYEQIGLDGGYRGDLSARAMPLDSSPLLSDVHFVRGAIRKEYGWTAIGAAAGFQIAAIQDFFDGLNHNLVRITSQFTGPFENHTLRVDIGSGLDESLTWSALTGTGLSRHKGPVSAAGVQGLLVFCRGERIYQTNGGAITVLGDSPDAMFVVPFGDRLLALQAGLDPQALAWSSDGDVLDWTGGDSGEIVLVDTKTDSVDELATAVEVGYNSLALLRRRSIMRVFETGNTAQAVGAVSAKVGVGTDFPFSAQHIGPGAIFLASDLMVYIITSGFDLIPVGLPIYEDLVSSLVSTHYAFVVGAYDPIHEEYYLGYPEGAVENVTKVAIFDVGRFLSKKEISWRYRPISAEMIAHPRSRMTVGGGSGRNVLTKGILIADLSNFVNMIRISDTTKAGVGFNGSWQSPTLNRQELSRIGTLRTLTIFYKATAGGTLTIRGSGDGGQTWLETQSPSFFATGGRVRSLSVGFDAVTGDDLRFDLTIPDNIEIYGYRPGIIARGRYAYV